MALNGRQVGELTEILLSAFTLPDLTILVRVELEINLAASVATDRNWRTVAFDLINAMEQEGRLNDLMRAIRKARPQHAALVAFCDPLLASPNGATRSPSAEVLRTAVATFNDDFHRRNSLFKYLNAYKELHDVLHELQSFFPKVAAAAAERTAAPTLPLADDVTFYLEDRVRIALERVKEIEFPDKPPAWVARLAAAVAVITGPDVDKIPRQVERLRMLPSEGLAPLNDKLFENASRLRPSQLTGSLTDILTALGPDDTPTSVRLRREVEEFRALCGSLDELINAHNLCQTIDGALNEAAGLPSVTPDVLAEWGVARRSLDELAAQRKDDRRVQRTTEAARWFEAANQAQAFGTLVARFDDLFLETDKALLRVTNRLPQKAMALHATLEEFR